MAYSTERLLFCSFCLVSRKWPNKALQLTLDPSLPLVSPGCVPRLSAAELYRYLSLAEENYGKKHSNILECIGSRKRG